MTEINPSITELEIKIRNISVEKLIIPFWKEISSDLETPVSAYGKVCGGKKYSFLLESAEGGEQFGRYSFIGFDPLFVLKSKNSCSQVIDCNKSTVILQEESPYELLKSFLIEYSFIEQNIPSLSGAVGYLGYDTVRFIEPKLNSFYEKIEHSQRCESFPDAYFMVSGISLVFDHVKHKIYIISNEILELGACNSYELERARQSAEEKINRITKILIEPHNLEPLSFLDEKESCKNEITSNISRDEWESAVEQAKEHIKAGDIFQVVLSQRFCVQKGNIDNFTLYRALRSINPSPYMYFLDFGSFQIIGSSPEALVKCSSDKTACTRPIAGTRRRGNTTQRDKDLEIELLADPKERAEHVMLVDLARNDLGRVCEYGSVKVYRFMDIERFSHVMHISSDVSGKLRDGLCAIDLLKACFPAGTVSGAPKVRAMQIIYELEKSARGPYAGCIGFVGFNNELNVAITLRTMLVNGDKIFIQAGAGIVADSFAELEYLETQNKAAALIQAVQKLKKII